MSQAALPATAPGSEFLRALAALGDRGGSALPEGTPDWLAAHRRDELAAVLRDGLPGSRAEHWKYTPLRALERRAFALAAGDGASLLPEQVALPGLDGPRLVFVDGQFSAALSSLASLPAGLECAALSQQMAGAAADGLLRRLFATPPATQPADAFVRLNAALAGDGVVLRVAPGTAIEEPVQLVFAGSPRPAPLLWSLRNLVELGEGASLTLVERWLDVDGTSHLGNVVTDVELGAGAHLRHLRLQQGAAGASAIARTDVQVAEGGRYAPMALELGAGLSRHAWSVRLAGRNACAELRGIVLAAERQAMDTRYAVEHAVGGTRSDTLWRAMAGGRARAAFHGGIHIAEGADGSDAALETKNLLLSDNAEIDAQPVLVIEADEVKASHGATVGQLDPASLFYLRARGLPEREARRLLVQAFCGEVLARGGVGVDVEDPLARALHAAIADRLAAIGEVS